MITESLARDIIETAARCEGRAISELGSLSVARKAMYLYEKDAAVLADKFARHWPKPYSLWSVFVRACKAAYGDRD